jgi:hypothetical protein
MFDNLRNFGIQQKLEVITSLVFPALVWLWYSRRVMITGLEGDKVQASIDFQAFGSIIVCLVIIDFA